MREIVVAAVFECLAEGEVFEPAIGTGYSVEAGLEGLHRDGWNGSLIDKCGGAAHDSHLSESRYGVPGIGPQFSSDSQSVGARTS